MSSSASATTTSAPAPTTGWIFVAKAASRCSTPEPIVRTRVTVPAIARGIVQVTVLAIVAIGPVIAAIVLATAAATGPVIVVIEASAIARKRRIVAAAAPATTPGRAVEATGPLRRTGRGAGASTCHRAGRRTWHRRAAGRALPAPVAVASVAAAEEDSVPAAVAASA